MVVIADKINARTGATLLGAAVLLVVGLFGGKYLVVALALSAVGLAAVMLVRPARTLPWRVATLAASLWAVEEVAWAVRRLSGVPTSSLLTDLSYYLGLAAWLAAVVLMPGKRLPRPLVLASLPALGLLFLLLFLDPPASLDLGFPVLETLLVIVSLPLLGGTMAAGASEGRVLVVLSFYFRALGAGSFTWLAGPSSEMTAQFLWLLSYATLALGVRLELDDQHAEYLPLLAAILSLQIVSAALLLVLFRLGMLGEAYALVVVALLTYVQLAVVVLALVMGRANQMTAERELKAWAKLFDTVTDVPLEGTAVAPLLEETLHRVPAARGIEVHRIGLAGALDGYPYPLVAGGAEVGRLYLAQRPGRGSVIDACAPMLASRLHLLGDRDRWAAAALSDPLTGLLNRRGLEVRADLLVGEARADGAPLSVAMLDIDHFKRVNDVYGHGVGDEALKALADILRRNLRPRDQAVRWGGEEFVLVLPRTDADQAMEVVRRVRHELSVAVIKPVAWPLAVSVGIAGAKGDQLGDDALLRLIEEADGALGTAKSDGRNRVVRALRPAGAKAAGGGPVGG